MDGMRHESSTPSVSRSTTGDSVGGVTAGRRVERRSSRWIRTARKLPHRSSRCLTSPTRGSQICMDGESSTSRIAVRCSSSAGRSTTLSTPDSAESWTVAPTSTMVRCRWSRCPRSGRRAWARPGTRDRARGRGARMAPARMPSIPATAPAPDSAVKRLCRRGGSCLPATEACGDVESVAGTAGSGVGAVMMSVTGSGYRRGCRPVDEGAAVFVSVSVPDITRASHSTSRSSRLPTSYPIPARSRCSCSITMGMLRRAGA